MSTLNQTGQDPYNRHLFKIQNDLTTMERLRLRVTKSTQELKKNLAKKSFYKNYLLMRVPIIRWLFLEYKLKRYLFGDLISGFTVGIMNIPQGMAYALLASLAPVNGLYISFFPVLIYALFGTSKQLSIGSFAVVSILSSDAILSLSNEYKDSLLSKNMTSNSTDSLVLEYKVVVACSLAALVGLVQILMGLTGLGVITKLFSDSFISGYTCGSSIHVLTSQIKDLFGLKGLTSYDGSLKIPLLWINMFSRITTTNLSALITTISCLVYLIIFKEFLNPRIKKRFKFEFPSELLLVIVTTLVSYFFKLNSVYDLDIISTIPRGLPIPDTPDISLWGTLFKSALIISIISFSINISLATLFAKKHGYEIDSTQVQPF
jgi:MFS superfamily sulfate permease-like transporter